MKTRDFRGTHLQIFELFSSLAQIQKKRAYLTIAAIAWGTVAILLLLAFGEGLKRQLSKNRAPWARTSRDVDGPDLEGLEGMPPGRPIRPSRRRRVPRKAPPGAQAVIGEMTSRGARARLRSEDGPQRPGHRNELGVRRGAEALSAWRAGRFLSDSTSARNVASSSSATSSRRTSSGTEDPGRQDPAGQQRPLHRDRGHAEEDADGRVRRPGQGPRRHSRSRPSRRSSAGSD
jgi:hypothetical protein